MSVNASSSGADTSNDLTGVTPLFFFLDGSDTTSSVTSEPFQDIYYTVDYNAGDQPQLPPPPVFVSNSHILSLKRRKRN